MSATTASTGGCLKDGPLKDLVTSLAHAFADWVEMIHRSRQLLAEDSAHSAKAEGTRLTLGGASSQFRKRQQR